MTKRTCVVFSRILTCSVLKGDDSNAVGSIQIHVRHAASTGLAFVLEQHLNRFVGRRRWNANHDDVVRCFLLLFRCECALSIDLMILGWLSDGEDLVFDCDKAFLTYTQCV